MTLRVDIWTDINCPFCYIGKARFEAALAEFPHRDQVTVVNRSFELDPTLSRDHSAPVAESLAAKYGMTVEQARANEQNLIAQANELGLDYVSEGRDMGSSLDMHRLLHYAASIGRQNDLIDALYAANFAETTPLFGDPERLIEVAVNAGFDADAVRQVVEDPTAYADAVEADKQQAAQIGVRGVPFFVLDSKYAVSGAQPVELFAEALQTAWSEQTPTVLGGADAEACGPDGCEVPQQ